MRPPICAICDKRFDPSSSGNQIQFLVENKTKHAFNLISEKGFVGHPPGLEWFCQDHFEIAKKYQNYSLAQAMFKIKAELQQNQ